MVTLKCDICGGTLVMQPGATAKCDSCGMDYSTQMLSEKFAAQKAMKIDENEAVENCDSEELNYTLESSENASKIVEKITEDHPIQTEHQSVLLETDNMISSNETSDEFQSVFRDEDLESDVRTLPAANDKSDNNIKVIACVMIGIVIVLVIILIAVTQGKKDNGNEKYLQNEKSSNAEFEYDKEKDNGQSVALDNYEYASSYQDSMGVDIPNWYTINGVAVNGNELCFSRDDGLVMREGEEPLTVTYCVYDNDGKNLISMKEYIIFQNEEIASKYADELNTYGDDGRNNFGMREGESQYYSVGNILVEEFLPQYTDQNVSCLEEEISMYEGYGWKIDYVSSSGIDLTECNTEDEYVSWTNKELCDYSYSEYTFLMDSTANEIITPTFEVYSSSIFVSTVLEFERTGSYYTDKSRYFDVELYDASKNTLVDYYTGMFDNLEGGVDFLTERNHSYYLKISTYIENGEKAHGHGHIYFD